MSHDVQLVAQGFIIGMSLGLIMFQAFRKYRASKPDPNPWLVYGTPILLITVAASQLWRMGW